MRLGQILQNLPRRPNRIVGMCQMSMAAASRALNLVMLGAARPLGIMNSFPFFTGLCEKESRPAASLALSAVRHK